MTNGAYRVRLQILRHYEKFKNCAPERVVVYLNEQKVSTLSQASVSADEFVLTHKNVFTTVRFDKTVSAPLSTQS